MMSKMVEMYCQLGKYNYECGDYQEENCIPLLLSPLPPKDKEEDYMLGTTWLSTMEMTGNLSIYHCQDVSLSILQVLWGKLACEILRLEGCKCCT